MCLQFGLVIFWQKDFGAKAAHKMLVKLTPDWVIFANEGKSAVTFCRQAAAWLPDMFCSFY
jgi:hypothetical protein